MDKIINDGMIIDQDPGDESDHPVSSVPSASARLEALVDAQMAWMEALYLMGRQTRQGMANDDVDLARFNALS